MVGALLLVAGLGAYWVGRGAVTSTAKACPSSSPTVSATREPEPGQVRLSLLNGTSRNGLATQVAAALSARGFVLLSQGTAPAALSGPSRITYGPGAQAQADVLARHVVGSVVDTDPRLAPGTVLLVLGEDFARLATPAEASSPPPAARASASARPCP